MDMERVNSGKLLELDVVVIEFVEVLDRSAPEKLLKLGDAVVEYIEVLDKV